MYFPHSRSPSSISMSYAWFSFFLCKGRAAMDGSSTVDYFCLYFAAAFPDYANLGIPPNKNRNSLTLVLLCHALFSAQKKEDTS